MSKFVGQRTETVPKLYHTQKIKIYKIKWAVVSKIQNKANGRLYNLTVVTSMEKIGRHSEFIVLFMNCL